MTAKKKWGPTQGWGPTQCQGSIQGAFSLVHCYFIQNIYQKQNVSFMWSSFITNVNGSKNCFKAGDQGFNQTLEQRSPFTSPIISLCFYPIPLTNSQPNWGFLWKKLSIHATSSVLEIWWFYSIYPCLSPINLACSSFYILGL